MNHLLHRTRIVQHVISHDHHGNQRRHGDADRDDRPLAEEVRLSEPGEDGDGNPGEHQSIAVIQVGISSHNA